MKAASFKKRFIVTCVGLILVCLGLSLCLQGHVGLDPFGALNKGLGSKLGLSLGSMQLIINLILITIVFYFDRSLIGIGTLINMSCCGYLIDFFSYLHSSLFVFPQTIIISVLHLLIGLLIFTIGLSIYICSSLGIGPYDALCIIVVRKFGFPFKTCRIVQDVAAMSLGLLLSAPVGVATIIMAFFIGPLVSYWNKNISERFLGLSIQKSQSRRSS